MCIVIAKGRAYPTGAQANGRNRIAIVQTYFRCENWRLRSIAFTAKYCALRKIQVKRNERYRS